MYWIQSRGDLNLVGQILSFASFNVGAWGLTLLALIEKPVFGTVDRTGDEGKDSSQWLYLFKLAVESILFTAAVPFQVLSDWHDALFDTLNWATGSFMTAKRSSQGKRIIEVPKLAHDGQPLLGLSGEQLQDTRLEIHEPFMNAMVQGRGALSWSGDYNPHVKPSGLTM